MTFSKFRYAIASLLLIGASSLLVSCVGGKTAVSESQSPIESKNVYADCVAGDGILEDSDVPVTSKKTSKKPKKAPAKDYADCIATE